MLKLTFIQYLDIPLSVKKIDIQVFFQSIKQTDRNGNDKGTLNLYNSVFEDDAKVFAEAFKSGQFDNIKEHIVTKHGIVGKNVLQIFLKEGEKK